MSDTATRRRPHALALQGLTCNGCVNKTRRALTALDAEADIDLDTRLARVTTTEDTEALIAAIREAGFDAAPVDRAPHAFLTEGVSCQGCVGKIRRTLQEQDAAAVVEGEPRAGWLTVDSALDTATLTDAIETAGYRAEPAPFTTRTRRVPGMSCQGCVKRMREALQARDPLARVEGEPSEKRLTVASYLPDALIDTTLAEADSVSAVSGG